MRYSSQQLTFRSHLDSSLSLAPLTSFFHFSSQFSGVVRVPHHTSSNPEDFQPIKTRYKSNTDGSDEISSAIFLSVENIKRTKKKKIMRSRAALIFSKEANDYHKHGTEIGDGGWNGKVVNQVSLNLMC